VNGSPLVEPSMGIGWIEPSGDHESIGFHTRKDRLREVREVRDSFFAVWLVGDFASCLVAFALTDSR
jgi:hypothetical protein